MFKQKTAYEVRMSGWSSDVCSSDLAVLARAQRRTWLAGGVVVGIALVLAWLSQRWLQRRVVHPLRQLRDQVGEQRGAGHAFRTHELDDLRQGIAALRRRMDEANHSADERVRASASEVVQQSRSEEHTSELQSLMRNSYAVFCLKNTTQQTT